MNQTATKYTRLFPWSPDSGEGAQLAGLFRSEQSLRHWLRDRKAVLVERGLLILHREAWLADVDGLAQFVIDEGRIAAMRTVERGETRVREPQHDS